MNDGRTQTDQIQRSRRGPGTPRAPHTHTRARHTHTRVRVRAHTRAYTRTHTRERAHIAAAAAASPSARPPAGPSVRVRARPPARPSARVCVTRRAGGGGSSVFFFPFDFRLCVLLIMPPPPPPEDPSQRRNFTQRHRYGADGRAPCRPSNAAAVPRSHLYYIRSYRTRKTLIRTTYVPTMVIVVFPIDLQRSLFLFLDFLDFQYTVNSKTYYLYG